MREISECPKNNKILSHCIYLALGTSNEPHINNQCKFKSRNIECVRDRPLKCKCVLLGKSAMLLCLGHCLRHLKIAISGHIQVLTPP